MSISKDDHWIANNRLQLSFGCNTPHRNFSYNKEQRGKIYF